MNSKTGSGAMGSDAGEISGHAAGQKFRRFRLTGRMFCLAGACAAVAGGWVSGVLKPGGTVRVSLEVGRTARVELAAREESGKIVRREFVAHPGLPKLVWAGPGFKKTGSVYLTIWDAEGVAAKVTGFSVARPAFRMTEARPALPARIVPAGPKERVSFEYRLERLPGKWTPIRESAGPVIFGVLVAGFAGWGLAWLWLERRRIFARLGSASAAHPRLAFASLATFALVAAMALSSRPNAHPDERWHYSAAGYFADAWRLPARDAPECAPSVSAYGYSYLWTAEPVYFLIGKFMRAVSLGFPGGDPVIAARLFQAGLFGFCLLGCLAAGRPFLGLALLCSGQMWYLFSYVNGDALALAAETGLLLCALSVWPGGSRRLRPWIGAAAAVALMLASKKTAWFAIPPAAALLGLALWERRGEICGARRGEFLRGGAAALVVFLAVAGALRLHEALRLPSAPSGGGRSGEEAVGFREEPTPEQQEKLDRTTRLRERGVGLDEVLIQRRWLVWSAASAFGVYGWMAVWQQPWFYVAAWALFAGLGACALRGCWRGGAARLGVALVCAGSFAALIGAAAWWSWTVDLQPQGRYWLPGFLLVGLAMEMARPWMPRRLAKFLGGALFLLALYGFCFGGLARVDEVLQKDLL